MPAPCGNGFASLVVAVLACRGAGGVLESGTPGPWDWLIPRVIELTARHVSHTVSPTPSPGVVTPRYTDLPGEVGVGDVGVVGPLLYPV